MIQPYVYYPDLAKQVEPPSDGTLSRTLYNDDGVKVVLFGFAGNQELSEHTASMPAIMHFLSGDATVQLSGDRVDAHSGSFVYMPAGLPHAIRTKTPVVMLLLLLKSGATGGS